MIITGLLCQPTCGMDNKNYYDLSKAKFGGTITKKDGILSFFGASKFGIKVGRYLDKDITKISFFGPSGPCEIEETTFDGLENAGPKLKVNLEHAWVVNWKNLLKAMKKYKVKYGYYPEVTYRNALLELCLGKALKPSVYNPEESFCRWKKK